MKKKPFIKYYKLNVYLVFIICFISIKNYSQNNLCSTALPICIDSNYSYNAGVNAGSAGSGPDYGCLGSQPNPAWYYLKIENPGSLEINMVGGNSSNDIDFCCWGPYSPLPACDSLTGDTILASHHAQGPGGGYPNGNIVDCSYAVGNVEWCYIPNAISGEYYILLITNYGNSPCMIHFLQDMGTGTFDCSIAAPQIINNSPLCEGQTLNFTVIFPHPGATYDWSGPNGFTSTLMNPFIPNFTNSYSGIYTMTMTENGTQSAPLTTMVSLYSPPVITLYNNDSLVSNSIHGNQWYYHDSLGSTPLIGDTLQYYIALSTGYYFTVVDSFNDCNYDTSNMIYVQITDIIEYITECFNIYPNPSKNNISVELVSSNKDAILTISNLQGQQLMQREIKEAKTELDISSLARGMYFVKVKTEKGIGVRKFVKE